MAPSLRKRTDKKTKLNAKQCHLTFLKLLKKLSKQELRDTLSFLSDNAVDSLCEVLFNCLYSEITMPKRRKMYLKQLIAQHRRAYHKITDKEEPVEERRKLLQKQSPKSLYRFIQIIVPVFSDLTK